MASDIRPYFMIDKIEIDKLGEFFSKFREPNLTAEQHFENWASTTEEKSLEVYTNRCFADAFHFISKYAQDEQEFREWNIELTTKRWEYERQMKSGNANAFLKQVLINRALVECQGKESWPDFVIQSEDCCRFCAKHHGKRVTIESILKGFHLPYNGCKRDDYCTCSYKIAAKEQPSG